MERMGRAECGLHLKERNGHRPYGVRWQRVRSDNAAPADTAFADAVTFRKTSVLRRPQSEPNNLPD
jgi:hypothetical protein